MIPTGNVPPGKVVPCHLVWLTEAWPGPASPFVCSGWRAISGVRRMLRGAGILPGRQWLCIGPCKAYLWNATSSHPFVLQSETLGSPSSWPSVDLHTALFLFLHKSLLVNVDLWEKSAPVPTLRLLCWRSDWVCNNKGGDTSITGFVFDHRVLFMSPELKTFLSMLESLTSITGSPFLWDYISMLPRLAWESWAQGISLLPPSTRSVDTGHPTAFIVIYTEYCHRARVLDSSSFSCQTTKLCWFLHTPHV